MREVRTTSGTADNKLNKMEQVNNISNPDNNNSKPVIEIKNLKKSFGNQPILEKRYASSFTRAKTWWCLENRARENRC
jgi:hypothetical protein